MAVSTTNWKRQHHLPIVYCLPERRRRTQMSIGVVTNGVTCVRKKVSPGNAPANSKTIVAASCVLTNNVQWSSHLRRSLANVPPTINLFRISSSPASIRWTVWPAAAKSYLLDSTISWINVSRYRSGYRKWVVRHWRICWMIYLNIAETDRK